LQSHAQLASDVVGAGELVRIGTGLIGRRAWTQTRIEALYELAFMRLFADWESLLEDVFHRCLCGFAPRAGRETLVPGLVPAGTHFRKVADAEAAVLNGQAYVLWHNPARLIGRCQRFFRSGAAYPNTIENVISSNLTRLQHLGAIRHRVVHNQSDARTNFDAACLTIAGRTFPKSRPGKLLREFDASTPPRRWLDVFSAELVGLASQMV
jgi:hypothetical protein